MFCNPCLISLVPISKLLLSMVRFDICDDELTSTNPPLSLYEFVQNLHIFAMNQLQITFLLLQDTIFEIFVPEIK